jgi:hypothetical protein
LSRFGSRASSVGTHGFAAAECQKFEEIPDFLDSTPACDLEAWLCQPRPYVEACPRNGSLWMACRADAEL